MCVAMSLLITKRNKVYWKAGVDSHEDLRKLYKKDKDLRDDKDAPDNTFVRIEIKPKHGNYLKPDTWVYAIDERIRPSWLTKKHEKMAWDVWKQWKKKVYTFNTEEALHPIHPFSLPPPKKIRRVHLDALREWASVGQNVGESVWESVWENVGQNVGESVGQSVWENVGQSVWESVWENVGESVGASVGAYIGSLFPKIKKWKYIDNGKKPFRKIKGYPFQSAVRLWKLGLVPSFDGEKWRLHGGKDAKILWEENYNT